MQEKENNNFFIYILLAGILIVTLNSFYFFYLKKDYSFIVETSCDPYNEICLYRDCENEPDLCPPNQLSNYKEYTIKANDYKYCENEDCKYACENNIIICVEN